MKTYHKNKRIKFIVIFLSSVTASLALSACSTLNSTPQLPQLQSCANSKVLLTNLSVNKEERHYMTENDDHCSIGLH